MTVARPGSDWDGVAPLNAHRSARAFGDFRTLWIDPEDSDRMVAGSDGGVFASYDGGKTSDHFPTLRRRGVRDWLGYGLAISRLCRPSGITKLEGPGEWAVRPRLVSRTGSPLESATACTTSPDPHRRCSTTRRIREARRVGSGIAYAHDHHADASPEPSHSFAATGIAPIRISPHDSNAIYYGAQVLLRSKDAVITGRNQPRSTTNDRLKSASPGIRFNTAHHHSG